MYHLVVAALEFGTTTSGYAFSFKCNFERDPLKISFPNWNNGTFLSVNTLTCLLLNKKKQYVAFGYDAEDRYAELVDDEKQDDYYFFDRFTMSLHNNENVTRDMVLKDKTGKQCSAVKVFSLSMKYFFNHLMTNLKRRGVGLRDGDIRWVLPVPAAWTESCIQLMRESSVKAGLHAKNVLLITKPDAAFTYCHYIPTARQHGSNHGIMIKDPGTKSMVVDLRDKAAYITVLQQNYNGQLNVLCRATGDDCGGASVTDRFCNMLEEIIGGNVIAELKKQEPADWRELLQQVRIRIEAFQTRMTSLLNFRIPEGLYYVCLRLHGKDLKYAIGSSSYARILRIKPDAMIKLFTPTINSIITLMKNTVANKSTNGLSNILMVGEFSECSLIQEAVKKAFPDKQIIIPKDAGLSVLNGAVLFGHRPNYIRSVKGDSLEDDDDDDDDDDDGCIGK